MSAGEGVRPAGNGPAPTETVAEDLAARRAVWRKREQARNRLAMDRYISDTYGAEWVTRSRS
jgi:hypothetical protein